MKYAFFIGCVAPTMTRHYELSTRRVAKELDIELIDVDDFACCGFPIRSLDTKTALLLAARDLSIAERLGLNICTICPGCAGNLTEANKKLEEDEGLREEVNDKLRKIGREYHGGVKVKHFAKVLTEDIGQAKIKERVKKSLEPLTIASHYGCHYVKPTSVYGKKEDPEFPRSLDELITITGAKSVDYEEKMKCCGGNILGVDQNATFNIASRKLDHIKTMAADTISVVCPLCDIIYDRNQKIIEREVNKSYGLPVLFYPQILGLSLGLDQEELGLKMNRVEVASLLSRL